MAKAVGTITTMCVETVAATSNAITPTGNGTTTTSNGTMAIANNAMATTSNAMATANKAPADPNNNASNHLFPFGRPTPPKACLCQDSHRN